jgi:hypothetical protein
LLVQLAKIYRFLTELVNELEQLRKEQGSHRPEAEASIQSQIDSVSERMHDLGWKVARISATNRRGAHAKSTVLSDWCEDRGDLKDALARSLCLDLDGLARDG